MIKLPEKSTEEELKEAKIEQSKAKVESNSYSIQLLDLRGSQQAASFLEIERTLL